MGIEQRRRANQMITRAALVAGLAFHMVTPARAADGGDNLHRNVIFRDAGDKAVQMEPFTTVAPLGSDDPRALWKWMTAYEAKTGGSVLAIAHNGNLSNGRMFPLIESFTGKPVNREYAEQRAH